MMKEFFGQLAQTIPGSLNNSAGNDSIKNVGGTDSGLTDKGIFGANSIVSNVINIILYIVGIVAVIMLIVGGIMYATSAGDEKKVTTAKATIVAALIGLAVAILAWTLVNFVFVAIGG
jgi:hypothetical protein